MPIKYIGPQTLEGVFQNVYSKISKHYERENPIIVVGVPSFIDFLEDKTVFQIGLEKAGLIQALGTEALFSTQKEFNEYVDTKIKKLTEILEKTTKVKKSKYTALDQLYQEALSVLKELEKISFATQGEFGGLAAYNTADDCLHFDAYGTALYLFGGVNPRHKKNSGLTNLPQLLRHELVHHDIGECLPFVEMRGYHQEVMYYMNHIKKWGEAVEIGGKAIKKWREEDGGNEFLQKLQTAHIEVNLETVYKEMNRIWERIEDCDKKLCELGIQVGDEALAYAYIMDKDTFKRWLNESEFAQQSKALDLYDSLERRVNQQGKLKTLREVKEAINIAYTTSKNLLDLI